MQIWRLRNELIPIWPRPFIFATRNFFNEKTNLAIFLTYQWD